MRPNLIKVSLVVLCLAAATMVAHAIRTQPAPAPLGSNASWDYSTSTFSSQSDCQGYEDDASATTWPAGAFEAAKKACCDQTTKQFDPANHELDCKQSMAQVKCNGEKCPQPGEN